MNQSAVKVLNCLGTGLHYFAKAREVATYDNSDTAQKAMELLRNSNADLVRWVHVLTKSDTGDWIAELTTLREENKRLKETHANLRRENTNLKETLANERRMVNVATGPYFTEEA